MASQFQEPGGDAKISARESIISIFWQPPRDPLFWTFRIGFYGPLRRCSGDLLLTKCCLTDGDGNVPLRLPRILFAYDLFRGN